MIGYEVKKEVFGSMEREVKSGVRGRLESHKKLRKNRSMLGLSVVCWSPWISLACTGGLQKFVR